MADLINEKLVKARKEYHCMATPWIEAAESSMGPEFSELLSNDDLDFWNSCDGKIKKGDVYIRQFLKDSGDVYTFRAIPRLHKLCIDHEFYCE